MERFEAQKPIGSDLPLEPDGSEVKPGPTDTFGLCVRFGCGAVLGILLAAKLFFSTWISILVDPRLHWSPVALVEAAGIVLMCGFLAARYGDSFWYQTLGSESFLRRWYWYR
jgi:tetrahydromethanopterin S-methyltransferase subunit E